MSQASQPDTQYTPGPWEVIYPGGNGYSPKIFVRKNDLGGVYVAHVAVSRSDWEDNKDEIEANACLIAAAPDLLAICQEAVMAFENLLRGSGRACYCGVEKGGCTVCKLRAAIARATGGQP